MDHWFTQHIICQLDFVVLLACGRWRAIIGIQVAQERMHFREMERVQRLERDLRETEEAKEHIQSWAEDDVLRHCVPYVPDPI